VDNFVEYKMKFKWAWWGGWRGNRWYRYSVMVKSPTSFITKCCIDYFDI